VGICGPSSEVPGSFVDEQRCDDDDNCIWILDANLDKRVIREFAYADSKKVLRDHARRLLSTTHKGWRFYIYTKVGRWRIKRSYIAGEKDNG
jgi:hypothetical protein